MKVTWFHLSALEWVSDYRNVISVDLAFISSQIIICLSSHEHRRSHEAVGDILREESLAFVNVSEILQLMNIKLTFIIKSSFKQVLYNIL